jgi:UDP-glucose 4-epimerase
MDDQFSKFREVLVLGGAGFIGSHLVQAFLDMNTNVIVVDGLLEETGGDSSFLPSNNKLLKTFFYDVRNFPALEMLIHQSDLIIDAMALTAHHLGMSDPFLDMELNLKSHLHVINILRKQKTKKKVLYLGSRGQYGKQNAILVNESAAQNPLDSQGIHKAAAEHFYRIYSSGENYDVLSLRLTNCFGPRQKCTGSDIGLVGSFIRDLLHNNQIIIYGSARRKKDILFIKDFIEIAIKLCHSDWTAFEAVNIPGQQIFIEDLLNLMIEIIGAGHFEVNDFPEHIKAIDIGDSILCSNKVKSLTGGWHATDLKLALQKTIQYFRGRYEQ